MKLNILDRKFKLAIMVIVSVVFGLQSMTSASETFIDSENFISMDNAAKLKKTLRCLNENEDLSHLKVLIQQAEKIKVKENFDDEILRQKIVIELGRAYHLLGIYQESEKNS